MLQAVQERAAQEPAALWRASLFFSKGQHLYKRSNFLKYGLAIALISIGVSLTTNMVQARTPDDQLIIGMNMNNLLSLDPAAATGNDVVEIIANIYDFLLELDPESPQNIQPGLAEEWSYDPETQSLIFKIRQGVFFHSGNKLEAKDAAWSLQRVLKLNLALASIWKSFGFSAENAEQMITAEDEQTLRIQLPQPTDPKLIFYALATSPGAVVLDSELLKQHAQGEDYGHQWLKTRAAGSGAFVLGGWRPADVLFLNTNKNYWRKPSELKRVVLRHMTESQSLRLMLERQDLDVAVGMSVPDIQALETANSVQVTSVRRGTLYYVAMNVADPRFADQRVREAIRYLIDYDGINTTIMPHYGIKHQRPIQIGLSATLPDPGYKLDPEKAKALLAQAGYANGLDVSIRVLSDVPFINVATNLQSTLAQAGIRATILPGTGNQVYGAMRQRDFEIIVGRGGGGAEPHPHSSLRALLYNPDNRQEASLTNFQGWRTSYQNTTINQLIEQALTDVTNQDDLYQMVQKIYDEEVGAILPFSQMINTVVLAPDIRGYIAHPSATTRYRTIYKDRQPPR